MTTTASITCACGRPIRDNALLCQRCTDRFEQDLAEIPSLYNEIATTKYGQARTGGAAIGVVSRSRERPLPFDDRPVEVARELRKVLLDWSGYVVAERDAPWPRDFIPDLAKFLHVHLPWLRRRDQAPEAHRQIAHATSRLRGSVSGHRNERRSWGRCGSVEYDDATGEPRPDSVPCPAEVVAWPGARRATCEACGTTHELNEDRQRWLLEQARGELMYVAQLSKAVTFLGKPVADETIRSWVRRGRLVPHVDRDQHGREQFLVGDVLDLLESEAVRQAEAGSKPRTRRAC